MSNRITLLATLVFTLLAVSSNVAAQDQKPSAEVMKKLREFQNRQRERLGDQMMLQQFMMITQNKELLDDLEIIDEQRRDIEAVMKEFQQGQQEFMAKNLKSQREIQRLYADGQHEKAMQLGMDFQDEYLKQISGYMDSLKDILLPHQMKRIKQISRQQSAKVQSPYHGFIGLPLALAGELDLSLAEKKKLRAATREADKQLRAELEKLNAQMMNKVLDSLPREKREQYKELVGELYDSDRALQKIRSSAYRRSTGDQREKDN